MLRWTLHWIVNFRSFEAFNLILRRMIASFFFRLSQSRVFSNSHRFWTQRRGGKESEKDKPVSAISSCDHIECFDSVCFTLRLASFQLFYQLFVYTCVPRFMFCNINKFSLSPKCDGLFSEEARALAFITLFKLSLRKRLPMKIKFWWLQKSFMFIQNLYRTLYFVSKTIISIENEV